MAIACGSFSGYIKVSIAGIPGPSVNEGAEELVTEYKRRSADALAVAEAAELKAASANVNAKSAEQQAMEYERRAADASAAEKVAEERTKAHEARAAAAAIKADAADQLARDHEGRAAKAAATAAAADKLAKEHEGRADAAARAAERDRLHAVTLMQECKAHVETRIDTAKSIEVGAEAARLGHALRRTALKLKLSQSKLANARGEAAAARWESGNMTARLALVERDADSCNASLLDLQDSNGLRSYAVALAVAFACACLALWTRTPREDRPATVQELRVQLEHATTRAETAERVMKTATELRAQSEAASEEAAAATAKAEAQAKEAMVQTKAASEAASKAAAAERTKEHHVQVAR